MLENVTFSRVVVCEIMQECRTKKNLALENMADKVDATPKLSTPFLALNTCWDASLQELRNNTLLRTYLNTNKVQIMAKIWDRTLTLRHDKLDLLLMMASDPIYSSRVVSQSV